MKKWIKKTAGIVLSLGLFGMCTSAFAQPVNNFDNDDDYITMSVEEFVDLAEKQGIVVTNGKAGTNQSRMADNFTKKLTDNTWTPIGTDINLLNATGRVKVISLSDNIDSVDIKLVDRRVSQSVVSTGLKEGDWSDTIDVQFLMGYTVKVKANSSVPLSKSNPGEVTIYWSDQGDW